MNKRITTWLNDLGLGHYVEAFIDNDIDMDVLGDLTDDDLKSLGVTLGHRKRILRAAAGGGIVTASPVPRDTGAERRQLTVMFCDLVDSTALSVRIDAEDLRHIISSFQKCCQRVVDVFGGSVARYMGDGVLVYFGYPTADEHDPERAIRAGLEITRAVGNLNVAGDTVLKTRVGIATGEVIVGDLIGEGASQEHAVVGETPNLAARLQGLAEPDTVVVSHATRRLVGALFHYSDLGRHSLKGFSNPVQAWQVGHERDIESRFEANQDSGDNSVLLGREPEIERLVEAWMRARDGRGQSVLVTGEAGIGKSRLSAGLRDRISGEAHAVLRYFCVPYQQKIALYPIIEQLRRAASISRDDAPDEKRRKIEWLVTQFSDEPDKVVPLYCNLLGVPAGHRYPRLNLSPRLQMESVLEALIAQLVAVSRELPVLMVFEDLHWIDATSLDLLSRFMKRLGDLPALLVMTTRPEFLPPWPTTESATTLHLERLGDEDAQQLIGRITGGKQLPQEVVSQILSRTDGVPLFVEELTKSLLEAGVMEERSDSYVLTRALPDHAVPTTLQDSLMARLDRLGPGKKVAQTGAAIGRMFSYSLLARVSSFQRDEMERALERLAAAGLVFRDGTPPHADYLFKHALVQDVAYSTLLKENRLALHQVIADAMELYFPETADQQPNLLAHHRSRSEEFAKAIPLWVKAARQAMSQAAQTEALKHVEQAMELIGQLPDNDERLELELGVQIVKGIAFESTLGYAATEVGDAYGRARTLCEQLGRTDELVPVMLGLYVFHLVRGNFRESQTFAQRCVELSKASKNLVHLIESYAALGYVEGHLGNFESSRTILSECIDLYQEHFANSEFTGITAQDPCVASQCFLAIVEWLLGRPGESEMLLNDAFVLAERLGRPVNVGMAYAHATEYYHMRRDYPRAVECGQKGIEVSASHGYDSWHLVAVMHTGIGTSSMGNPEVGVAMTRQGIDLWQSAGARNNLSYFKGRTAWEMYQAGDHEPALELLADAFADMQQTGERFHASMLHDLRGQLQRAAGDSDDAAERSFRAAIDTAAAQNARLPELRARTHLCELLGPDGRAGECMEHLRELVAQFPEDCTVADLDDARAVLAGAGNRPN